jgi:hypothetical protein
MPRALTDQEREVFDAIREAGNIALVQTSFDGEETAVLAAVTEDGNYVDITPLAVLITAAILARLAPPLREDQ